MKLLHTLLLVFLYHDVNGDHYTDFFTPDDTTYKFFPIHTDEKIFNFKVKATNDVHVGLFTVPSETAPWFEIVIGGWGNTRSAIRKDKVPGGGDTVANNLTPDILDPSEETEFYINFTGKDILVGKNNESIPFMLWKGKKNVPNINFLGVHTGFGSTGYWTLYFNNDILHKNEIEEKVYLINYL